MASAFTSVQNHRPEVLVPIIAAAFGALAGGAVSFFLELWRRGRDSKALFNSVLGELLHMQQHYNYAGNSLSGVSADTEVAHLRSVLEWSKYGETASANDFQRLGILPEELVKELLQQSFRVRNADVLIDTLVDNIESVSEADLDALRTRLRKLYISVPGLVTGLRAAKRGRIRFGIWRRAAEGKLIMRRRGTL